MWINRNVTSNVHKDTIHRTSIAFCLVERLSCTPLVYSEMQESLLSELQGVAQVYKGLHSLAALPPVEVRQRFRWLANFHTAWTAVQQIKASVKDSRKTTVCIPRLPHSLHLTCNRMTFTVGKTGSGKQNLAKGSYTSK